MRRRKLLRIIKQKIKEKTTKKEKKLIIFKYKLNFNRIKDGFFATWRSAKVSELKTILITIIGYGIIGYFAYYALFIREHWYLMIIGIGCIYYIFMDCFDFIWKKIRIIWLAKK